MYTCDYCSKEIEFPISDENVPIFIVRLHNQINWFCSSYCRLNFLEAKCIDAYLDKSGYIIGGDK